MAATLLLEETPAMGCLEGGRLHREADLPVRDQVAADGQTSATFCDSGCRRSSQAPTSLTRICLPCCPLAAEASG